MVLAIPVWYLHPPAMVPQPSLPPQTEGIPMQIPIPTPTTPLASPLATTAATTGADIKRNSPPLPYAHVSNLLAHYVRKMDTQPTNAHLYPSYVT
jgi:hypothetical protein